jgi:hypothetical protein
VIFIKEGSALSCGQKTYIASIYDIARIANKYLLFFEVLPTTCPSAA